MSVSLSSGGALVFHSYDTLDRLTNSAYGSGAFQGLNYDSAGNRTLLFSSNPLTISSISSQTTLVGTPTSTTFSVTHLNVSGDSLTFRVKSSDSVLITKSGFSFSGSGQDRNVIITPAAGQVGNATVTIIVSDGFVSAATAFSLSVRPNQPPSFQKGADQAVVENFGSFSKPTWATMINSGSEIESGQHLSFIVSNDNPSIFSVVPQIDPAGTLAFSPRPGKRGLAIVTVQLHDDGGVAAGGQDTSAPQSFRIVVGLSTDSDGDGLPDDYELANGLNLNASQDALLDSDGDGFTNLEEFLAGTDPRDAESSPRISSIDGPRLRVTSVLGKHYQMERNSTFPTGPWIFVGNEQLGTDDLIEIDDPSPASSDHSLYRVRVMESGQPIVLAKPAGFYQFPLLGNSDTFVSIPFVRPYSSAGLVSSVSANVVDVTGAPAWAPNQWVYGPGTQTNTYFLFFASGAKEGRYFTITGNTGNSVTLDLEGDTLSSVAILDRVTVIPYWTLGSVFPGGEGIFSSPTPGSRTTEILIPDFSGAGINRSTARTYYFWNSAWRQVGSGAAVKNDDVLLPDGFFIVRHNSSASTTLTTHGSLVAERWRLPLNIRASGKQDNIVALPRPVSVSLNDSGLIESGAFATSPSPGNRVDELLVFNNALAQKNKSAAGTYYHWNGGWRKVGSGSSDVGADLVFTPGMGVLIRKGAGPGLPLWVNAPNY